MALISHTKEFIYLKTHKTGGTSMELALEPFCAPPGHVVKRGTPALISDEGIIAARHPHASDDTTGWVNHMHAAVIREKLGAEKFDRYFKVAMIRNPFDKAVSWFWHNNRHRELPQGKKLVREFRDFMADKDQNGFFKSDQDWDWGVCHIGDEMIVDLLLPLEKLDDYLPEVERRIGLPAGALDVPHSNKASRSKDSMPVAEYYDQKTVDILLHHWDWIFEAGKYSRDPSDAARASDKDNTLTQAQSPSGVLGKVSKWFQPKQVG